MNAKFALGNKKQEGSRMFRYGAVGAEQTCPEHRPDCGDRVGIAKADVLQLAG